MLDGNLDDAALNAGLSAVMQIVGYLNELFAERRKQPQDDLVSALLAVEEEGDRLTETELLSIVLLLFVAGHETTMNLIGNGTVALLRSRDQWAKLCEDPSLVPNGVEELLRFDGPVHATQRFATVPSTVGEVELEAGQGVICHLAAANRDPARWDHPDDLDVARPDAQSLTFSHGIHYCLGAALARLEGQETFRALARRFPGLELAEEPVHRDHFVLRGYRAVQLALPSKPRDGRDARTGPRGPAAVRHAHSRRAPVRAARPTQGRYLHLRADRLRAAAPRQHAQPARARPPAPGPAGRRLRRHLRHEHHRRRPPRVRRRRGRGQGRAGGRRLRSDGGGDHRRLHRAVGP
jgi:hypothetical protein